MKKFLLGLATLATLAFGPLSSHAGSVYDSIFLSSGYNSRSSTFASIPAGADVIVEASGNSDSAAAYASASGGGISNLTAYVTGRIGTSDQQATVYADTISYQLWVSDYGYAFVEIDW